jgi:hypothetical protein
VVKNDTNIPVPAITPTSESDVCGRQERVERGRDRGGCEQKRPRHPTRRRQKRLAEIGDRIPLGPVADAELDAEIDAEPYEKHSESDGDEVQRADHPESQGGGKSEPDR